MKVFVLVAQYSIDYESSTTCVGVYETREQAVGAMLSDKECAIETIQFQDQKIECSNDSVSIYEDGDYVCNHIDWYIFEKEITYSNEH